MKITEIIMEDDGNLDSVDSWLAKYTNQGLDKWPSTDIWKRLVKRYPADENIVLYRGMNFSTQEEWAEFIKQFKQDKGEIQFRGISSWTRSMGTAKQFAVTRPTYYLNRELMQAHDTMNKEKEHMIGYRGVILKIVTTADSRAVDANKSKHSAEDEIILPTGTYSVTVEKIVKKFAHSIEDKDETLESIIDQYLDIKNQNKTDEYFKKFYDYVLDKYQDQVKSSNELKQKVYDIAFSFIKDNGKIQDLISVDVDDTAFSDVYRGSRVRVSFSPALFILQKRGFLPDDKKDILATYADNIVKAYSDTLKKHSGPDYEYNLGRLKEIAPWVSNPRSIDAIYQLQIKNSYDLLNSKEYVKSINDIKDPMEKRKAIEHTREKMQRIMRQLSS